MKRHRMQVNKPLREKLLKHLKDYRVVIDREIEEQSYIAQSKVIEIPLGNDKILKSLLYDLSEEGSHRSSLYTSDLIKAALANSPIARAYVLDHVISKSLGPLDPKLRNKIDKYLKDPSYWVFHSSARSTALVPYEITEPQNPHADNLELYHFPIIRVIYSQIPTVGYNGWIEHYREDKRKKWKILEGSPDEGKELSDLAQFFGNNSLIVFDQYSGIHSFPWLDLDGSQEPPLRGKIVVDFLFKDAVLAALNDLEIELDNQTIQMLSRHH